VKLCGLCGFARSGKDTAALNMPGWTRMAFADALKNDLKPLLDSLGVDLTDPAQKEKARPLLVAYGATARAFLPGYWVDRLFGEMAFQKIVARAHENEDPSFVVTDVRYPNEVNRILADGGKVVYLLRPGVQAANDEETRSIGEILERYRIPVVLNDGTPEELGAKVLALVKPK